jgi:membrane-associated phospholipid phosphatase
MNKLFPIYFLILLNTHFSFAQNRDIEWLKSINSSYTPTGGKIMKGFTHSINPISLGLPAGLLIGGIVKKDKELQWNSYELMASGLINGIITTSMKFGFDRDRPFITYPNDITQYTSAGSPSFPSGHTSMAFNTAMTISLIYPKWCVIVPSFAWASTVGFSRMYLGVHYPSDVFAGALIGCGTAIGTHYLFKHIKKKQAEKNPTTALFL